MDKENTYTYAVVGTDKSSKIRKVIAGGFRSKESAEKRLMIEKSDKYMRKCFRNMRVAQEPYHPRKEGNCGSKLTQI